jgi:hypothetical protein
MEAQILHYDLLWLQSIPSISHIYYSKYLKETHLIHSPNKDQPIRAVARSIMKVMKQVSCSVVVYFMSNIKIICRIKPERLLYTLKYHAQKLEEQLSLILS